MFAIDTRSLAAIRIGLALVMMADLILRAIDIRAHYSDGGVMPRTVLIENFLANQPYLSIHILHGSTVFASILFVVAFCCALAMLVGYRTRLFTIACWYLTASLQARNPLVNSGADDLLRLLMFWGMFLPLGARWSVDRLRNNGNESIPVTVSSFATAGLLLQVCFLYFFTGILKSHPSWRHDGTAVYLALSIDQFTTPFGKLLLPYHDLLEFMTYATLGLEILGPYVAILTYRIPLARTITCFIFMGFHIGLGLCLELGIFPAICIVAWMAFLPSGFWDFLAKRKKLTDFFKLHPNLNGIVEKLNLRPIRIKSSWEMELYAGFFIVYILLWNIRTCDFNRFSRYFPTSLNWIGELTRVDQYWSLFAPYPTKEHGWYVIPAKLADGTTIDIFSGKPLTWEKPTLVSATYRNERWRKYLMNIAMISHSRYRQHYARYLCRDWNRNHQGGAQVKSFEIFFVQEVAMDDYRVSEPSRLNLWNHNCTD